jgi:hypothetical protein
LKFKNSFKLFSSINRRDSAASRLKETERRERRRKGLPPLKEDHLVGSLNQFQKNKITTFSFTFLKLVQEHFGLDIYQK